VIFRRLCAGCFAGNNLDGGRFKILEAIMLAGVARMVVLVSSLFPLTVNAATENVHIELNSAETVDNRCRLTFVIQNTLARAIDSFNLDLVLFNPEGIVSRRLITEMAPIRDAKTVVKTFAVDGDCAQVGSILVNDVTACAPDEPATCLDMLGLSSRMKGVRLYK
jgi:hypothetical protein